VARRRQGATGRNIDACERVQEHGIHVFGNVYFNSLRMMQSCYQELPGTSTTASHDGRGVPAVDAHADDGLLRRHVASRRRAIPDNRGRPWLNNVWPEAHGTPPSAEHDQRAALADDRVARPPNAGWLRRIIESVDRLAGDELTRIATTISDRIIQEEQAGEQNRAEHAEVWNLLGDAVALAKRLSEADPRTSAPRDVSQHRSGRHDGAARHHRRRPRRQGHRLD
jgi:uncharacterized protein with NAD-binding domain and iron-sulfur cluster